MGITCIVVEDEPLALEKLEQFIGKTPWLDCKATFTNGIDALSFLQSNEVQLMFLDIQMNGITGIQLLDSLPQKPQVILTTAYSEYALKGYEYSITDYLLKPFSYERFLQAIQKVKVNETTIPLAVASNFMFVKSDYRIVKIEFNDILYIEGMRDFRCIVTQQGKTVTSTSFTELETLLPQQLFSRIHKSYIVSLQKIKSIEHHRVYITDKILPIGESFKHSFYVRLKNPK
jgi:DNA-binding LytR/AlgR family response regulator